MHFCVHFGYFKLVCVTETCCFTLSPYTTILFFFFQRHDPPDLLKTIFVLFYKALISIVITF